MSLLLAGAPSSQQIVFFKPINRQSSINVGVQRIRAAVQPLQDALDATSAGWRPELMLRRKFRTLTSILNRLVHGCKSSWLARWSLHFKQGREKKVPATLLHGKTHHIDRFAG